MSNVKKLLMAAAGAGGGYPSGTPTDATTVFKPVAYSGDNSSSRSITGAGFAPDMALFVEQTSSAQSTNTVFYDDQRGQEMLATNSTQTESYWTGTSVRIGSFGSDGVTLPSVASLWNASGSTYCLNFFKEAPTFFDIQTYTGNSTSGKTVAHSLQYIPELIITKGRNYNGDWAVYHAALGNTHYLRLNEFQTPIDSTEAWNDTDPTDTEFTLGSGSVTNNNNYNYISYLFSTVPNVSKVGNYTGNGGTQTIDCGFSSSARFIIIKRTDTANSTSNWYQFDTGRGISSSSSPFMELDETSGETSNGDINPNSSGFEVVQSTNTDMNVSSATYIFFAVA